MAAPIGPAVTAPVWEPISPAARFQSLRRFGASVFAPETVTVEPAPQPAPQPEQTAPAAMTGQTAPPAAAGQPAVASAVAPTAPAAATGQIAPTPAQTPTERRPAGSVRPPGTPLTGMPVPPNYVLGPGDVLEVHLWSTGREQHAVTTTVSADGFVFLPLAGKVVVAGHTIRQAQDLFVQAYQGKYERPEVTVVLSGQRAVDVYVLGDVRQPGKYSLLGMATVFSALYAAGGPSETGSFRHVRLLRTGAETKTIDLYDYLLRGENTGDELLQAGDTVFVSPARTEIGVYGEVRRPARYELKEAASLREALDMAGGLTPQGYAPTVEVWRTEDHRDWRLANLDVGQEGPQLQLQDGDLVVVKPLLAVAPRAVSIKGAVQRPDVYEMAEGLTAAKLIRLAQGPLDGANLETGIIWRLNAAMGYDLVQFSVSDALAGVPDADVPLRPHDTVQLLPRVPALVNVKGAVLRPGEYPFGVGMRVSDLVTMADGLVPDAYTVRADLLRLRPDQRYEVMGVALAAALAGDEKANIVLQRADILEIKNRADAAAISEVQISGFVLKPGRYPRYEGMMISDLIFAAGGLMPGASSIEYSGGQLRGEAKPRPIQLAGSLEQYALEPNLVLKDDDHISVQAHGDFVQKPLVVLVRGQVGTQGAYGLLNDTESGQDTVWGVLQRAGGLLPDADPNGIVVYRGYTQLFSQSNDLQQVLDNYNRETRASEAGLPDVTAAAAAAMNDTVSNSLAQAFAGENQVTVVIPPRRLQLERSLRAISVDGEKLVASKGREADVQLEAGDVIVVPRLRDTVAVVGCVMRPGAVPYQQGLTVRQCIALVGGVSEDAALKRAVVLSANGSVRRHDPKAVLRPGDVVVVPSQHVFRSYQTSSTLSQILRSLAGAASVFLLSR